MKILAMAASNSSTSINHRIILHAADLITGGLIPDAEVQVLDLNDFEMPIYSSDREAAGGVPEPAQRFYELIGEADAIVLSFAEHNGSYSAAYKNLYDWTSRVDMQVFQDTPLVTFATSPGGRGGSGVLQAALSTMPFFGGDVRASLSIPSFHSNFDVDAGVISDEALAAEFHAALQTLAPA